VMARVLGENKRMPNISREDVIVTQGKDRLRVTNWVPARGLDRRSSGETCARNARGLRSRIGENCRRAARG